MLGLEIASSDDDGCVDAISNPMSFVIIIKPDLLRCSHNQRNIRAAARGILAIVFVQSSVQNQFVTGALFISIIGGWGISSACTGYTIRPNNKRSTRPTRMKKTRKYECRLFIDHQP